MTLQAVGARRRPLLERPDLAWGVPAACAQELARSGVALLASRASGLNADARVAAALGQHTAARTLAQLGLTRPHELLPSVEELARLLEARAATRESVTPDGQRFVNRSYLHMDLFDDGLVMLMQYGTGTKLDSDYTQPAIDAVAEAVRMVTPTLLFANEVRGWGRAGFAMASLVHALNEVGGRRRSPVFVGDDTFAIRPMSTAVEQDLFNSGAAAAAEAARIAKRTRDVRRQLLVTGSVDGPWRWPLSQPPPPPLAEARLKGVMASTGPKVAYLDTPGCRPDPRSVLLGAPRVVVPGSDSLADQLEILRWFYATAFTPGWDAVRTVQGLIARGFSTAAYRRTHHDPAAALTLRRSDGRSKDASHIIGSIVDHGDFHVTGILHQRLTRSEDPVDVQVLTPDGLPIAQLPQLERIREALAVSRSVRPRPRVYLFSGHRVRVNGVGAVLAGEPRRDSSISYTYVYDEGPAAGRHAPAITLPHDAIVEAIVVALANAGRGALVPALTGSAQVPDQLESDRAALEASLRQAESERARSEQWITEMTTRAVLSPAAVQVASRTLEDADQQVTALRTRLQLAELAIRDAATPSGDALPLADLFPLTASLRDPLDQTYRRHLRACVEGLQVESRRDTHLDQVARQEARFGFTLRLADERGQEWHLPVNGEVISGGLTDLHDRLAQAIISMRKGAPAATALGSNWRRWLPYLRVALGHAPDGRALVTSITDPYLLTLTMDLMYPEGPSGSAPPRFFGEEPRDVTTLVGPALGRARRRRLAAAYQEPVALIERIAAIHTSQPSASQRWLLDPNARLVDAVTRGRVEPVPARLVEALSKYRDISGYFRSDAAGYRVPACPQCRHRELVVSRLREVTGLICGSCRHDRAGVFWPREPFASFDDIHG